MYFKMNSIIAGLYSQWHYEAHLANELERLNHIRIKRNPQDFPDRHTRRQVRNNAAERITRRRLRRKAETSLDRRLESRLNDDLPCPVCNLPVPSNAFTGHIETCLKNCRPEVDDNQEGEDDDEVDVDSEDQVETYTWAGITRIRATSLVEGGLRGPGFVSITQSDEDQVLDIEGDTDEADMTTYGSTQFTEADLIPPRPENEAERVELQTRNDIQMALTGTTFKSNVMDVISKETTVGFTGSLAAVAEHDDNEVKQLQEENEKLRQKSMCNICMDSYETPLVSTVCWHVSCQECWMRALGSKKLCPQCKVIIQAKDLRRIYL